MRNILFLVLCFFGFGLFLSFQQEVFGQATSSYPYSSFLQNGSPTSGYEYTLTSVVLTCPDCDGGEYYPPPAFSYLRNT